MSDPPRWLDEDLTSFQASVLRSAKDDRAPPSLERHALKALGLLDSVAPILPSSTDIAVAQTTAPGDLATPRAQAPCAEWSPHHGSQCSEPRPRPRRSWARVALGSAIAGALVGAGGMHLASSPPMAPMASAPATVSTEAPASTGSAMPPAGPVAVLYPDLSLKHVKIVVMPTDAQVEVDGSQVTNKNGVVEIVGMLGSVHKVRLIKYTNEATTDVVVTDVGADPVMVRLEYGAVRAPTPAGTAPPSARYPASMSFRD